MAGIGGYLTTHVLDTARGCPAAGMRIALFRVESEARTHLRDAVTNDDGRTDTPILPAGAFSVGEYELVFEVGAYQAAMGMAADGPRFLDSVPVRFGIDDPGTHYHVPLLVSPFGYSTYRGS